MTAPTPRVWDTITTADQLDALPEYAMVRDHMGSPHVKYGLYGGGYAWQEVGFDTAEARSSADMLLEIGGTFPVLFVPGAPSTPPAEDTRPDITEQAARVLDQHSPQTDRSAQDGCLCGSPDTNEGRHQAEALAAAGLLAAAPTTTETPEPTCPDCGSTWAIPASPTLGGEPVNLCGGCHRVNLRANWNEAGQ